MWKTARNFIKTIATKTKIDNTIVAEDVELANKFDCFIQNDMAEFYVDYVNGNDGNDGLTKDTAVKTMDKMISICRDYGAASNHFYFMSAGDYIANNYKNIGGISIHFHCRAEGVRLIFRNTATARSPNEDYTAFYGCHYNFGSTQKKADGFNFRNRMTVIFQSNDIWSVTDPVSGKTTTGKVSNSYFENCSTVFNGCDIYSQDLDGNNREFGAIGFAGGNMLLDQCRVCCKLMINYCNGVLRNTSILLLAKNDYALYMTNSKVMYYNELNGDLTPKWEFINQNVLRINTNQNYLVPSKEDSQAAGVFLLNGCTELNLMFNALYQIADSLNSVNKIQRILLSNGGKLTCSATTVNEFNLFNLGSSSQVHTIANNAVTNTLVNGHFNATASGGNIVGG